MKVPSFKHPLYFFPAYLEQNLLPGSASHHLPCRDTLCHCCPLLIISLFSPPHPEGSGWVAILYSIIYTSNETFKTVKIRKKGTHTKDYLTLPITISYQNRFLLMKYQPVEQLKGRGMRDAEISPFLSTPYFILIFFLKVVQRLSFLAAISKCHCTAGISTACLGNWNWGGGVGSGPCSR